MKILITGGDGFIARSLFKGLQGEYSVTSMNREKLDLLDSKQVFKYIKNNFFDVVIHAATYDTAPVTSTKDPAKVLENNLNMFFNLARCQDCFGKMIYFGSGAEFGRQYWKPKMKEDYFGEHIPIDAYGLSKYIMSEHAAASRNIFNLRLFGVFGEYDDWRYRFISNACCKAVLNLPIVMKQNKIFDFLYIHDLIKIVKWFVQNEPQKHVYNVCSGQAYAFKALAQKIISAASKNLEIIAGTDNHVLEYSGDNSLLRSEVRDFKFSSIDDAIGNMYQWYEENKHMLKKEEFHY